MNFDLRNEIDLKKVMPDKNKVKALANFFYAFSDDTRLKIIITLILKPLCVGEISNLLNINQTTVSHQLKILKSLNIISCERAGKNMFYYIKNSGIENLMNVSVECF